MPILLPKRMQNAGQCPRQIPIAGEPADVVQIVSDYSAWLSQSDVPKLFVNAEPGGLIAGPVRDFVRSWPEITEVTVPGIHFIQEDSPDLIGEPICLRWKSGRTLSSSSLS